jgi:hypothetical protein
MFELQPPNVHDGISPGNLRLITFAWDPSLGNFRLGSFTWELSLGIYGLGTFVWDVSLGNSYKLTLFRKLVT